MYSIYSFLLTLGFLLLLPRFLFDAFRHGKYVSGFRERFGFLSAPNDEAGKVIWLHCVSVGETQAARPLVRQIRQHFPDYALVVSTTTLTGQKLAREVIGNQASRIIYFPFDWRWTVRRTLKAIRPTAVLIMETEIWPNFLRECQSQRVSVALVNGRISNQSFRRYSLIRAFVKRILSCVNLAIMQTEADAYRLRQLGFSETKLFVSGNLKFDAGAEVSRAFVTEQFQRRFDLTVERPLILAASTHDPEERIVLESFQKLRLANQQPRLLLAPRHPERSADVSLLLKNSGLIWTKRSDSPSTLDPQCDVILLDTIGELPAIYPLASIVFVGGSLAAVGGHNILEPATVGACIITGPHTNNFALIVRTFVEAEAIIQLPRLTDADAVKELATLFQSLLLSPVRRRELGTRAMALVEKNKGATQRTLDLIRPLLLVEARIEPPQTNRVAYDANTA